MSYVEKYGYKKESVQYKKVTITRNNIIKVAQMIMDWCDNAVKDQNYYVTERDMYGIREARESRYCVDKIEAELDKYDNESRYNMDTGLVEKNPEYGNPFIHIESPVRMNLKLGSSVYFNEHYLIYGNCSYKYGFTNTYLKKDTEYDVAVE